jgi:hypothetical protein
MRSLLVMGLVVASTAVAQTVQGVDPHVAARVIDGGLELSWNPLAGSGPVTVRRQAVGATLSTLEAALDAGATSHVTSLARGQRALFRVQRAQQGGFGGEAVVLAGLDAPFTDDQGVALVLVDASNAIALRAQLDLFVADLRDDGFEVVEQSVRVTETPPQVKARIAAVATMAGARPLHVVLLGAVPRAYSGVQAPDGHSDHRGAWPADPYYADLTGLTYTDTGSGGVGAFANDAGDGKFDQSFTSAVECAVGRVDFERMPSLGADAGTVQLGRYLDKVHQLRIGAAPLPRRALVRPTFGYFNGEAFGRAGYRDGTAITGAEPSTAPFFPTLESDGGVLLAWGDGPGSPTSCGGVTTTAELSMRMPQTRFMGLFGSYFGDWNYPDNLMRASLASGATVASTWYARPQVQLFALGALESFGRSFSRDPNFVLRPMPVYQALLGDPTLRLFYPLRLGTLSAQPIVGAVRLQWTAFAGQGELLGYHVYRLLPGAAPTRLTMAPLTAVVFDDVTAAPSTTYEWRVVAVVRETTGSGTFWNHSLGARATATTLAGAVDAGVATDAGVSIDAGVSVDAGGLSDAGPSPDGGAPIDAGTPVDAGRPIDTDAGAQVDAGAAEDAGRPADAGAADAGDFTPLPTNPPVGCTCQQAGPSALVLALLGLLLSQGTRRRALVRACGERPPNDSVVRGTAG